MASDSNYDLCVPILEDANLDEEQKTADIKALLKNETSLDGQALEEVVLNTLWRHRDVKQKSGQIPRTRPLAARQSSRSPWNQTSRSPASSLAGSPVAGRASPAPPPGFGTVPSAFLRSKSFGTASPFTSPRPSPRLAFASPIPHSPTLSNYESSEAVIDHIDYGDYGTESVDWLLGVGQESRPSSSGAGSIPESDPNAAAAAWIQPRSSEMSLYDMLRSIMGGGKTDGEIETALESNGYDLSATMMTLTGASQQEQDFLPERQGQILIGKSMAPTRQTMVEKDQQNRSSVLCKYWLAHGSCLRADCRFSHDLEGHICKYWLMGSCLAGESCIFSHDPAYLLDRMSVNGHRGMSTQAQPEAELPVQDLNMFPSLKGGNSTVTSSALLDDQGQRYDGKGGTTSIHGSSLSQFEPRMSNMNGTASMRGSPKLASKSRHRATSPSIVGTVKPALGDKAAFPSLGSTGGKSGKRQGDRSGSEQHILEQRAPGSLADIVRRSTSPLRDPHGKESSKSKSYKSTSAAANSIPAPQHVPWLETGSKANQEYLKARQEAFKHGGLRNKFLQSAAQAWSRNDARAAKALSLRGQSENDLMRTAHREAAQLLYEQRNKNNSASSEIYIDLHGLHPDEAIEQLERILLEHQTSARPVYAITGTGHHSKNGKDKVGKAIRTWLSEWKYVYREFSVAGDGMGGILGIAPSTFDKTLSPSDDYASKHEIGASENQTKSSTKLRTMPALTATAKEFVSLSASSSSKG